MEKLNPTLKTIPKFILSKVWTFVDNRRELEYKINIITDISATLNYPINISKMIFNCLFQKALAIKMRNDKGTFNDFITELNNI